MGKLQATCVCLAAIFLASGCGSTTANPAIDSNVQAAADMASSIQAGQAASPTGSADQQEQPTPQPTESDPSPEAPAPESSGSPAAAQQSNIDFASAWQEYPWGSNGLECPHPSSSPGVSADPLNPTTVVIIGDSLVRDARGEITTSLESLGYEPVFICWGGKNLEWGLQQVDNLRSLELLPRCLVFNLGTNDLKGTTAQGLTDAVSLEVVGSRLTSLLASVSDVDDVFAVDIAANLALAPSTMKRVGEAPATYRQAAQATGVGDVIDWAQQTQGDPGLIGADGIHDTEAGRWARAQLIANAVARDCG